MYEIAYKTNQRILYTIALNTRMPFETHYTPFSATFNFGFRVLRKIQ